MSKRKNLKPECPVAPPVRDNVTLDVFVLVLGIIWLLFLKTIWRKK
jgi:hypothetical protein